MSDTLSTLGRCDGKIAGSRTRASPGEEGKEWPELLSISYREGNVFDTPSYAGVSHGGDACNRCRYRTAVACFLSALSFERGVDEASLPVSEPQRLGAALHSRCPLM